MNERENFQTGPDDGTRPPAGKDEYIEWVTIQWARSEREAQFARIALEKEDIPVFLKGSDCR